MICAQDLTEEVFDYVMLEKPLPNVAQIRQSRPYSGTHKTVKARFRP